MANASASSSRWPWRTFFFSPSDAGGAQFVEIHGAQAAGEQQLLGIEQLIQLFWSAARRSRWRCPRRRWSAGKQQRQADAQAQAGKSFHASPRV
jgi:hypothetical protein